MKSRIVILGLLAGSVCICGCQQEEEFAVSADVLDLELRQEKPYASVTNLKLAALAPSNVIVAVNGYPLTKRVYDDMMMLKAKSLSEKSDKANVQDASKELDKFSRSYLGLFVSQRLLIDNALQQGVVTKEEVAAAVSKKIRQSAKAAKKPVADVLRPFKGRERYFYYELATSYVMDKLISAKIPPLAEVNDTFVANFQSRIKELNAAADVSNQTYRAELAALKEKIEARKITFEKAAGGKKGGVWGEMTEDDFPSAEMGAAAFALKVGEISPVLEDETTYQLLKILSITPSVTNAEGALVGAEKRKVAHIVRWKEEKFVEEAKPVVTQDLKNQMQMRAVDNYVQNLKTNGQNRIEFPYGEELF